MIVFERESDPTKDYQIRNFVVQICCESLRLSTSGSHGSEVTTSSAKTLGLLVVKKNEVFRTLKDHLSKQFRESALSMGHPNPSLSCPNFFVVVGER